MMKKLILIVALAYGLTACAVVDTVTKRNWEWQEEQHRSEIAKLQINTNIEAVLEELGTPQFNEIKHSDEKLVQVLYYRTQRVREDGNTTKDECTPLLFVDGKLRGWGYDYLNASGIWS